MDIDVITADAGADVTAPDVTAPFRSPEQTVPMNWRRLRDYLQTRGHALSMDAAPRQFAGGLANLNYLIELDGQPCVLRRPPPGPLPPGANDMAREHRVLGTLWRHYPLAPRSLHYCADPDVLGAHFLIMEYRAGLTIGADLPPNLAVPDAGQRLGHMLVELLAWLHDIDVEDTALATLGKPDGFLARAIEGWARRADTAVSSERHAVIDTLVHWLRTHCVPDGAPTLLHCDFKLDNVILDPVTLQPRAVLDWDMATRGHPLFDLATLLSYWTEPGDPEGMRALRQMPTVAGGFPSRQEIVDAYARCTGRDASDFPFHRVLAMFKLGVVFLQLHARYVAGTTRDPKYAAFGRMGWSILDFTHEIAHGRAL